MCRKYRQSRRGRGSELDNVLSLEESLNVRVGGIFTCIDVFELVGGIGVGSHPRNLGSDV